MSNTISAIGQLFDRLRRFCVALEAKHESVCGQLKLAEERIADLRDENERLKRALASERAERAELVDQVIDWLGQGEGIVRAGVEKVPGANGQRAGGTAAEVATRHFADFDRSYGGADNPV